MIPVINNTTYLQVSRLNIDSFIACGYHFHHALVSKIQIETKVMSFGVLWVKVISIVR